MHTILVVEDEPTLVSAYLEKLQDHYRVVVATTGAEGILQAQQNHPDLILLDIILPGGQNGYDVLRTLKLDPKTKEIPVLMVTNLDVQERQTAIDQGATDYIVKTDTSLEELMHIIDKYLP